jgi:hypothetical protein
VWCGDVTGYSGGHAHLTAAGFDALLLRTVACEGRQEVNLTVERGRMGWEGTLAVVACPYSVHRPLWPGPSRQLPDITDLYEASRNARILMQVP